MKRSAIIFSLIIICLTVSATAFGQKGCELNIIGTWKAEKADGANTILYRFAPDATVTVLSKSGASEMREVNSAVYKLDDPKAPKVIDVIADKASGVFVEGTTSMEITGYDDTSITFVKPGSAPTRWIKVDPYRYFMVLAGRIGTFYDGSGPTFPMMIKLGGQEPQIDAVGIFANGGKWVFGAIPSETYNEFMKEPRKDSDVMLRLELTGVQYERALKIVKTWDRRARYNELLYPDLTMDNILLAKQVTESLNQCGEKIDLYKLDWSMEDHISSSSPRDDNPISRIPYLYFKELRRRNESLHVRDDKFYGSTHQTQQQAAK